MDKRCHNRGNQYKGRHTGGGRYPETIDFPGFRVALRLHGMTRKVITTQYGNDRSKDS